MYRKVLAAVNEYSNSEVSARYAITFAKACNASLSLIHVHRAGSDAEAFNRAEAALKRLFHAAETSGVGAEIRIESGDPLSTIEDVVRRDGIDIVFLSTRRDSVGQRFFARTLSRDLLLSAPCAVALVRMVHVGKIAPKRILVPLRGRIAHVEERALFVAKLSEGFGSSITLFHTLGAVDRFFHGERHMPPVEREQNLPPDIGKFIEQLNRYSIAHDKRTGHGSVSHAIAIEAMIRRNDLIVMGASERGLLKSIIYGNPVEDVLRETPCNLIIFKASKK